MDGHHHGRTGKLSQGVNIIVASSPASRAIICSGPFLRFAPFMGFCARKVPQPCKTTVMDPNGPITVVLQGEGRFNLRFLVKIMQKREKSRIFTKKSTKKPSLTLQNGGYGPVRVHNRRFARLRDLSCTEPHKRGQT